MRWVRQITLVTSAVAVSACATAPEPEPLAKPPIPTPVSAEQRYVNALNFATGGVNVPAKGKAIVVNIPSFELIAFEDGLPVLRSRVIVGKPSTQTPVMETQTSVVRFRPTWRPTPRMVASGKYEDKRWPAGKRNPLGFLAIRLEPGMLIYLHGTNKPQLFEREKRALSHGCVRVEKWDEVAAWVLGVDLATVHDAAFGRRTFDMDTSGVPVIMTYHTIFPDADGVLFEHRDIYRRQSFAQATANVVN